MVERLDDEDPTGALEGTERGDVDQPVADVGDGVPGPARNEPDEVRVGRRVEQGPAPGLLRVLGDGGQELGREGPGEGGLAGAGWAGEQVGVGRPLAERPGQYPGRAGLVGRGPGQRFRGRVGQDPALAATASTTARWTSGSNPEPSRTRKRSVSRPAISR